MSLHILLKSEDNELYSANITHNLGKMAVEAGVYETVWRAQENGLTQASHLVDSLRAGVKLMQADKERFEKFNASNGWGTYEQFLPWLEDLLTACVQHPTATVCVNR